MFVCSHERDQLSLRGLLLSIWTMWWDNNFFTMLMSGQIIHSIHKLGAQSKAGLHVPNKNVICHCVLNMLSLFFS